MMTMPRRTRDRRDIGRVIFPIEQLMAARAFSSCCAGQEAMLETGRGLERLQGNAGWTLDPLQTGVA